MSDVTLLESVFRLFHLVKKELHLQIDALGLELSPMHIRVLKVIASGACRTANDVVQWLSRDKAQVTRLLNSLMTQGLLAKTPNPDDKRSQLLALTEAGRAVMTQVEAIDERVIDKMSQDLNPQQITQFKSLVAAISRGLDAGER
ncbi:MarR family transcriptional regulator [Marinobacter hydrocarbonoclasticus]|nr:MarR family transcriptional regulator [Marinobacter nauticus]